LKKTREERSRNTVKLEERNDPIEINTKQC